MFLSTKLNSQTIWSCFRFLTDNFSEERFTFGTLKFDRGDFTWIILFNLFFLVLKEIIRSLLTWFTIRLYKNFPVKCLRLERIIFLRFGKISFFDILIHFEKIFPGNIWLLWNYYWKCLNLKKCYNRVITVIKVRDLLLTLLQVITILAA